MFRDSVGLVDEKSLAEIVFKGELPEVPVTVKEVRDHGRAIYLKLSKTDEDEGGDMGYWVCVPQELADQVRAHRTKEAIYLSAGSFPTKDEAQKKAREWMEVARAKKIVAYDPEIWSVSKGGGAVTYRVVLKASTHLIQQEKFALIGEGLGVTLLPVSSDSFREWVPLW